MCIVQEWQKAIVGLEWAMLVSFVLIYLSYFDEFRYITIKPDAVLKPRGRLARH